MMKEKWRRDRLSSEEWLVLREIIKMYEMEEQRSNKELTNQLEMKRFTFPFYCIWVTLFERMYTTWNLKNYRYIFFPYNTIS